MMNFNKTITRIILGCTLSIPLALNAQTYINFTINQPQPLQTDAGLDTVICTDDTLQIGGNPAAQFGTAPYTFLWAPATYLSDPNIANPLLYGASVGNYQYVLTVTDSLNCQQTDTMNVQVDPCPGMDEAAHPFLLSVYPNPTQGRFTVVISGYAGQDMQLSVINNIGQSVFEATTEALNGKNSMEVDLSAFPKGIYLISARTDHYSTRQSITIY